jgi:hypothetical protein
MQLFNEHGRRIPFPGMRVYNQVSRRYYWLNQPPINFDEIYYRTARHLEFTMPFSAKQFAEACQSMLHDLQSDELSGNITKGIQVPFLCPPLRTGVTRGEELGALAQAVGQSFKNRFPNYDFYNRVDQGVLQGNKLSLAPGSRYERMEEARRQGPVIGWYFPICLSEYDLDSQRAQTASLPEQFILSGGAETAAALVGCPDLLFNKEVYPYHLCLSALQDPDERFFLSFEAYGQNLVFNRRSNVMTPTVKQLSEQFAGGLTVITSWK